MQSHEFDSYEAVATTATGYVVEILYIKCGDSGSIPGVLITEES
jgi:hypothetical protein